MTSLEVTNLREQLKAERDSNNKLEAKCKRLQDTLGAVCKQLHHDFNELQVNVLCLQSEVDGQAATIKRLHKKTY